MIGLKAHNIFSRGDETFLMLGIEGLATYERAMAVLAAIGGVIAKEERRRRREVNAKFRKAARAARAAERRKRRAKRKGRR